MKNKLIVFIIGGHGSGKSTVADHILIHDGFTKIVSSTTRKRRDGEHDGREYYFVDDDSFNRMKEAGEFVEFVVHDECYGLNEKEFLKTTDNLVCLINPHGCQQIIEYIKKRKLKLKPFIIHMDISEKERFKNMIKAGYDPIEIQEILKTEKNFMDFKKIAIKPDLHIKKLQPDLMNTVMDSLRKQWLKLFT